MPIMLLYVMLPLGRSLQSIVSLISICWNYSYDPVIMNSAIRRLGDPENLVFSGIAPEVAKPTGFATAEFSCSLAS